jgi:MFS transporter, FHS family, Na+ dependent glucose transporter 1
MIATSTCESATITSQERRRRHFNTAAYCAAFVGLGMTNTILGPTLPGLAAHTHTHLNEISFLFTAKAFGYLIGSSQGGRLYDRLPGHALMASCVLLLGLALAAAPTIPALWLLTAILFLWGLAEGGVEVGGTAMLLWAHGTGVSPWMNGMHLAASIGGIAVPLIIAGVMVATNDISGAYWIVALLMLPMAAGLLRLPSPVPQRAAVAGQDGEASTALVALFALFLFFYVGFEIGFGGWIYTYATATGLMTATSAAVLISLLITAMTVARVIGIPVTARFQPGPILAVDLLLCLAGVGAILIWPASVAALRLGCITIGVGMATLWPTTMSLAGHHITMTGRVAGWLFVGPGIGAMFLPWLIGQRFEADGPRVAMLLNTLDLVLTFAVFVALLLSIRHSVSGPASDRAPRHTA